MADTLRERIATLVSFRRQQARLTQAELAKAVGLARASITNIENGRQSVSIEQLYNIAAVLNIPITSLLPESLPVNNEREQYLRRLKQITKSHPGSDE